MTDQKPPTTPPQPARLTTLRRARRGFTKRTDIERVTPLGGTEPAPTRLVGPVGGLERIAGCGDRRRQESDRVAVQAVVHGWLYQ